MSLTACPACRALFDDADSVCPECGYDLRPRRLREKGGVFDRLAARGLQANLLVIVVNVALFVVAIALSRSSGATGGGGGFLTSFGVDGRTMVRLGGLTWFGVVREHEWWRIVCPIFLHFGPIHILFNCYVIRVIGRLAEQTFGPSKFLVLFLLAGIAGSFASLYWHRGQLFVGAGASGAAFGLLGMMAAHGYRTKNEAIKSVMIRFAVFALLFGVIAGADNAAHLGGFAAGALLGTFVRTAEFTRLKANAIRAWDAGAFLCAGLVVASFAAVVLTC